jgi:uncharacterized protein YjiS (DUF1127 family)
MSAILSTTVRPAGTKAPGAYLRIFNACWQGIARYIAHRAAIANLRELDDRLLRDIGLARSQIEAAAHGLMIEAAVHGLMSTPNRARTR